MKGLGFEEFVQHLLECMDYQARWTRTNEPSVDIDGAYSMGFALQDPRLSKLRDEQTPVSITLANGIKLHGRIESFDQFVVIVKGDEQQMVYKSAIANIQVARPSAIKKPHTPTTLTARREFNPVAQSGDDVQLRTRHKEPVVIVRNKLRTIAPSTDPA